MPLTIYAPDRIIRDLSLTTWGVYVPEVSAVAAEVGSRNLFWMTDVSKAIPGWGGTGRGVGRRRLQQCLALVRWDGQGGGEGGGVGRGRVDKEAGLREGGGGREGRWGSGGGEGGGEGGVANGASAGWNMG